MIPMSPATCWLLRAEDCLGNTAGQVTDISLGELEHTTGHMARLALEENCNRKH